MEERQGEEDRGNGGLVTVSRFATFYALSLHGGGRGSCINMLHTLWEYGIQATVLSVALGWDGIDTLARRE